MTMESGAFVEPDQGQLIARAAAGDEAACAALHGAHAGRVRAYFLRSGFALADADDLAQETFLRTFRGLGTYDPRRGAFVSWLGAIARNVARRRWRRRAQPDSFDPDLAEDMFPAEANPAETPEAREEIEAVRDCVAALPAELERVVRLRYVDGRTTRGIAEATGLPESTVRLRLAEAAERLAAALRKKGFLE